VKLLERALDLVFPPLCALCDSPCAIAVCGECEEKLELTGEETCRRCGATRRAGGCRECRGRDFRFSRAVAVGHYVGTLRQLLLKFKLGGEAHLAREFGRRLGQRVLDEGIPADVVVPVPMRRWATFMRGYNPAEELAWNLSGSIGRPLVHGLSKVRKTRAQATLPMEQRAANPSGAYAVRSRKKIAGRSVLLVDDVLTTGATANECSRVLMDAGAAEVHLAVVGR